MEMTPQLKRLLCMIKSNMRVAVGQDLVESSFPVHYRPSLIDRDNLAKNILEGTAVSKYLMPIFEYKPTSQMVEEFCELNGLVHSFDPSECTYYFSLKP